MTNYALDDEEILGCGCFLILVIVIVFVIVGAFRPTPTPIADPCGNGTYCVLNYNVTQATISSTICVAGWTSTIRPSTSYTEPIKLGKIADGENLFAGDVTPGDYELDHRMPLELGGDPKDLKNLSLEYGLPNSKDKDENSLRSQVCSGKLTLVEAQTQLVDSWLSTYPGYKA